GYNGFG
nr:Chain A, hnRNPA1 [Homo sapiens]